MSLLVAAVMLPAFVWHEHRSPSPMVPLSMFRVRNFAVGNLATFFTYAGLGGAIFLIVLYLQQIGGWSALEAGLVLLPVTVSCSCSRVASGLSPTGSGPRPLMGAGPIVAGTGLLLLMRSTRSSYVTGCCRESAVRPWASMTVAPLTATVLAAGVQHAGVASGVRRTRRSSRRR